MSTGQADLQDLVQRWSSGDRAAFERLASLLYDDLRGLARAHLRRERDGHTLTTTALVHEAYVQMAGRTGPSWQGRAKFFALVSKVMRHVLVDYARRRRASKRGGDEVHVQIGPHIASVDSEVFELLAVDQALHRLSARHERLGRIVECRFFGGMAESEIAAALGVSERTVERDWKRARAYLYEMLTTETSPGT